MEEENNLQPTRTTGRRKRSEVWDHFEQKAECKYCKALLCADPVRDGTSRLKKHYEETCPVRHPNKSRRATQQASPAASVQEGNQGLHNAPVASKSRSGNTNTGQQTAANSAAEDHLLRMIALHGFPSSLVEDAEFNRFIGMLCSGFQMPSREDVEERCDELFDQDMSRLKDALGRTPGLVSLSLGTARTVMVDVVFLVAHFIDDEWNLCRRVIQVFREDHSELKPSYGHILDIKDYPSFLIYNDEWIKTISPWGLMPKLSGSILLDHTYLISALRREMCKINHLEHLSTTQHKLSLSTNIHSDLNRAARMLASPDLGDSYGEHCLVAFLMLCLTKKKHRNISSRLRLNHPWTYDEWWYALYYALQILHNECSSRTAKIAGLVGEAIFQETDTTELIRTTLGAIYNAIEAVAASSSPTSSIVLVELVELKSKIDSGCTIASRRKDDNDTKDTDEDQANDSDDENTDQEQNDDDEDYDAKAVFERTKQYLCELFEESYLSLSIPLILDPRFRLVKVKRLLKKASIPPNHISEVEATVRQLFQEYSNQGNARCHTNHGNENIMDIDPFQQSPDSTLQTMVQSMIEQNHESSQESATELDAYLREKTVPIKEENFDILKWWKENCHRYPTVARMARDFLAIPMSTRPTPQMMAEITNHLRRYA